MSDKRWRKSQGRKRAKLNILLLGYQTILPLLVTSLYMVSSAAGIAGQPLTPLNQKNSAFGAAGDRVSVNGRTSAAAWHQWDIDRAGETRTAINDVGLMQLLGVELLNTKDAAKQPIAWFTSPPAAPLILSSFNNGMYRYLDITQLATVAGWEMHVNGNVLQITTPVARVQGIRPGKQTWGDRLVIDLDRPTPWQAQQQPTVTKAPIELLDDPVTQKLKRQRPRQEWAIAIDATTDAGLIQQFNALTQKLLIKGDTHPLIKFETTSNLTTIRLSLPAGISPRVSTLANPNRIVIDLRSDAMVERDIAWIKGLRWRQQFVNLGDSRFPVVWLEINPRAFGLTLKPIWSEPRTLVGIAPILKTAQSYSAAAAINGGFFNRNNKLPLGAIRRDGRWLSSPILNRGAIAWNDSGQVKIGRLRLQESLITSTGQRLPVLSLNSGYIQSGIARYTPDWGSAYTPLSNNEAIVVVQNNQVTAQLPGGIAGQTAFPIPTNGYLLALRTSNAISLLPVGTLIHHASATVPADFARYPNVLGAGPLLVQNRQIVLNAKAEGFSDTFIRQTAVRSAIGITAAGNLLMATVHNRAGGTGPTLGEMAKILYDLGCVDALNLDGGSSTSLYLGGQLLNRSPLTAARVHNGLGIFLQSYRRNK